MNNLDSMALKAINAVSHCFSRSLPPKETIQSVLEIISLGLGYEHALITLIEPESNQLLIEAAYGIKTDKLESVSYRRGEGITGVIMKSKSPLAIRQIGSDPRFLNRLNAFNPDSSFIGVPIIHREEVIGVFCVGLNSKGAYQLDKHAELLEIFANLTGGIIRRVMEIEEVKENLIREKANLHQALKTKFKPANMVGTSKVMRGVFETIQQVARWSTTVLIRGESGTGKELVAKATHYQSPRSEGPFIKLNCAALPDNLLESELFGHEKGAFTGALRRKPGRFELAHMGTIFLDEIGDTSPTFQAKLLRVLQEGQFERLGGEETITVDVRVITATNVDLEKAMVERTFREDLYYRLNVMPIFIPSLRERREDIPLLVDHILLNLSKEIGEQITITPQSMEILGRCNFPGNIRELENCLQRAAVTCKDSHIAQTDLPCTMGSCYSQMIQNVQLTPTISTETEGFREDLMDIPNERDRVIESLIRSGWVQAKAARLLNMTPRQINYRVRKLNIEIKRI